MQNTLEPEPERPHKSTEEEKLDFSIQNIQCKFVNDKCINPMHVMPAENSFPHGVVSLALCHVRSFSEIPGSNAGCDYFRLCSVIGHHDAFREMMKIVEAYSQNSGFVFLRLPIHIFALVFDFVFPRETRTRCHDGVFTRNKIAPALLVCRKFYVAAFESLFYSTQFGVDETRTTLTAIKRRTGPLCTGYMSLMKDRWRILDPIRLYPKRMSVYRSFMPKFIQGDGRLVYVSSLDRHGRVRIDLGDNAEVVFRKTVKKIHVVSPSNGKINHESPSVVTELRVQFLEDCHRVFSNLASISCLRSDLSGRFTFDSLRVLFVAKLPDSMAIRFIENCPNIEYIGQIRTGNHDWRVTVSEQLARMIKDSENIKAVHLRNFYMLSPVAFLDLINVMPNKIIVGLTDVPIPLTSAIDGITLLDEGSRCGPFMITSELKDGRICAVDATEKQMNCVKREFPIFWCECCHGVSPTEITIQEV